MRSLLDLRPSAQIPDFPSFVAFSKVSYDDFRALIENYQPYSDFNYTSVYAWDIYDRCVVSKLNNNLVLSLPDYLEGPKLLTFIGENAAESTANSLLDYVRGNEEYRNNLALIPEETAKQLKKHDVFEVSEDCDNHDYILSSVLNMEMDGSKYASARRSISVYTRTYGSRSEVKQVDMFDPRIQEEIIRLSYMWAFMGTDGSRSAQNEILAIKRLLSNLEYLKGNALLECLGLYIDNTLEGFYIFEIDGNYAINHFTKANLEFYEAHKYLMFKAMAYIYEKHGIDMVNYEQDLGIDGLRNAKQKQNPIKYLKKYNVSRRQ